MSHLAPVHALLFALGTAALAWVSRGALRQPRSHGFARFFGFVAILALLLLNYPHWERDMFSPRQCLSWALLATSIVLVSLALREMRARGRHDEARSDPALFGFEKTATLVTGGIFRWIRHPMYASLMALAWGIFLKQPGLPAALLVAIATLALLLTAWRDEAECLQYFGAPYAAYMQRSWRFVPGLY
ncbi:isoprenylcysteine carboxylmethyltransferase family protein [Xenophilus arseniciresistens]|uniref:Isoprenylcysteine carboxylmethyltransferase family protein n=1 Tax=Xenophilus arseniciresistens TaxID=1283306 RepID=A0AAE3N9D4_9BURK|nr:isoprenylcysteine carboxylmethyltransferase family protein [Xenophilus arseniciresistens]MDA7417013.1 isoprenylcysteine carboxylmethyltransferase family protein [Xenophilus arseniciresistens]